MGGRRPTLWHVAQNSGVRMNGFMNVCAVERRLHPDEELVDLLEHLVVRERERVLLALLDDVAAVPAHVLHLRDRVAGHAREPLLRLELVVRERGHRGLAHLAR